jgi:hypothetical protein
MTKEELDKALSDHEPLFLALKEMMLAQVKRCDKKQNDHNKQN